MQYFLRLLPMIVKPAEDLPVIRNSEAFSYLGHNVKAFGLVLAVLINRLWAALIIQKNLTQVSRKTIGLLMAACCLILTTSNSEAGLGWTLAEFERQYGKPVLDQEQIAGRTGYVFTGEGYIIAAFLRDTQVSRILYICRAGSVLDREKARALLVANAPDATWDETSKYEADNSYRVKGIKDGRESYYASLTGDGQMLAIWTKEDDEAGSIKRRLDSPSVSSVVGSVSAVGGLSEKSTGETTAGPVPSVDRELTSEKNPPEVPAPVTASSPAKRRAPTHAPHPKIAQARLRSSIPRHEIFHVATINAKTRSTASSRQHTGTPGPAPTPLLMNAGTNLYNSDYTQPFKNAKKTPGP
jgi:hypothetical protein